MQSVCNLCNKKSVYETTLWRECWACAKRFCENCVIECFNCPDVKLLCLTCCHPHVLQCITEDDDDINRPSITKGFKLFCKFPKCTNFTIRHGSSLNDKQKQTACKHAQLHCSYHIHNKGQCPNYTLKVLCLQFIQEHINLSSKNKSLQQFDLSTYPSLLLVNHSEILDVNIDLRYLQSKNIDKITPDEEVKKKTERKRKKKNGTENPHLTKKKKNL